MLRKGFTLIELLIVITIIAILAGAAIPYVQDYVEDARVSKTKSDISEIKNALIRFELDRGITYPATGTGELVGPYLDKAVTDAWGTPFEVDATSSKILSHGPDRSDNGGLGDDISTDFRPPLALSKAYWVDNDKNGVVSDGDAINVRFTRPYNIANLNALTQAAWDIDVNGAVSNFTAATTASVSAKLGTIKITTAAGAIFTPGRDTLSLDSAAVLADQQQAPLTPLNCLTNKVVIQPL